MFSWLRKKLARPPKPPPLDRRASLATRPVRNTRVKWADKPEGILLTITVRSPTQGTMFSKLFPMPATREVQLDEMGSEVWRLCDGEHTTADLLEWMRTRYQFSYKEAELGITKYLKELVKRNLVVLVGLKEETGPSA